MKRDETKIALQGWKDIGKRERDLKEKSVENGEQERKQTGRKGNRQVEKKKKEGKLEI